jgi:hypothetical protein
MLSTIGASAFASCLSLTKIDLGNITEIVDTIVINDYAFTSVPAGGEIWATSKQVAQDFIDAVHEANPA